MVVGMRERTAMLNRQQLSYLDSGHGPAVLFIHGLTGSHRSWAHLVDAMNTDHRVLAPDLFGHGASAKPMGDYSLGAHAATLRDLLDLLGVERVTLVGHSFGGGIAMQFCYLFPQRVERLVLVASGGLGREVSPLLRSATLPGAEWVLPLIASSWVSGQVETVGRILAQMGWRPSPDVTQAWHARTAHQEITGSRVSCSTGPGTSRTWTSLSGSPSCCAISWLTQFSPRAQFSLFPLRNSSCRTTRRQRHGGASLPGWRSRRYR
jgi:pimeloyl-ACP methyl ester carboxylesterase